MAVKYVRPEDVHAYVEARYALLGALGRVPPPRLYHYTTGESLIAIINSGTLWATQVANLNDEREILYSLDLLKEAIARRRLSPMTADVEFLFERVITNMPSSRTEPLPVFVTCFSANPDDLSQWRAYAGSEGGYAIEFDCDAIRRHTISRDGILMPVVYDPQRQATILDLIVRYTENFFLEGLAKNRAPSREEWYDNFMQVWEQQAALIAAFIKAPAFQGENEWRLVYYWKVDDRSRMQFKQRRSMITRHVPLSFADERDNHYTPLPINSIVMGPTSNNQAARFGVGDLLASKSYVGVPITHTAIPYRIT